MAVAHRAGAVVADPRLHVEQAIWLDHEQPVETDGPGAVRADRHADAADLRSVAFAAQDLALVPPEQLGALVERLLDERARDVLPHGFRTRRWSEERLASGRVDAANRHLIEPELARRLGNHRLHDDVRLRAARLALRTARRRVGENRNATEAHRLRRIRERRDDAGVVAVALALERAVVADREHVERGDAAVLGEAYFHPRAHARTGAADIVFLLAADAHHHRRIRLLCQEHRDDQGNRASDLAAEAAAGVLADDDDVFGRHADPAGDAADGLRGTLRAGVDVHLPVLPVRHDGPRLERLVARVGRDVGLVEDERGLLEASVEVAVGPGLGRLAHDRQLVVASLGDLRFGVLQLFDLGTRRVLRLTARGRRRRRRDVPV